MSGPLHVPVNVLGLVTLWLHEQPELMTLLDNDRDRVVTETRKNQTYPCVRLTQITDTPAGQRPLHLVAAELQIDAFGGTKAQAWTLAGTCRALLAERLTGTHPQGVVTGVDTAGMADIPDDYFTPAKPRWLFTATVYAHPAAPAA
jgi:hypothetical protein